LAPLGLGVDELEGALVGRSSVLRAVEAAEQLGPGRVQVVVALEIEGFDVICARDGEEGLQRAHVAMSELLDELGQECSGAPLILGGFSQGAMLAFDIALRSTRPIAALVQLSGARIARRLWDPQLEERAGMRAFISHGRSDPDLAFSATESFERDLRAARWLIEFCPFDGGHEVPLVALRALKRFLRSL